MDGDFYVCDRKIREIVKEKKRLTVGIKINLREENKVLLKRWGCGRETRGQHLEIV